jgi:FKBP-type peptidyl-prolyl cis-trans isomerase 2
MNDNASTGRLKQCAILLSLAFMHSGCAGPAADAVIRPGDRVAVHFTCVRPNGEVVISTESRVASDPLQPKSPVFIDRDAEEALELVASEVETVPLARDFEADVMQGIAQQLPGLHPSQSTILELAPVDSPYGGVEGKLTLPRVKRRAKEIKVSAEDFASHTGRAPEVGDRVLFEEEFPCQVKEVVDGTATLAYSGSLEGVIATRLGPARVRDAGTEYEVVAECQPGDLVRLGPLVARVASVDKTDVQLDFTKSYAGETLHCQLQTVRVLPALEPAQAQAAAGGAAPQAAGQQADAQEPSTPAAGEPQASQALSWIEDHDLGVQEAGKAGKPVFLMLYADWCGWCKKVMSDSIADPRVQSLKDRFVWVRVNSDREARYRKLYAQDGYPLMLVLNSDGSVRKRIDGYRDAPALAAELQAAL